MNCKVLISPLFILICAIAPLTLALGGVATKLTTPTFKTETLWKNQVAPNICIDRDGNQYHCP